MEKRTISPQSMSDSHNGFSEPFCAKTTKADLLLIQKSKSALNVSCSPPALVTGCDGNKDGEVLSVLTAIILHKESKCQCLAGSSSSRPLNGCSSLTPLTLLRPSLYAPPSYPLTFPRSTSHHTANITSPTSQSKCA